MPTKCKKVYIALADRFIGAETTCMAPLGWSASSKVDENIAENM